MWRQKLTEIKEGDNEREEPHVGQARGERARQAEDNVGEERETRLGIRKKKPQQERFPNKEMVQKSN